MFRILSIVLSGLVVCSHFAAATHYKLFVLTGDSNALGMTAAGEGDPSAGPDPADQHIPFFWSNLTDESSLIGTSGGTFTTLQSQQGGVYDGNASHWGAEISFGRTLYRAGLRDFAIIKATLGEPSGNSYWDGSSANRFMYDHLVSTVSAATTELTRQGHTYELVGLLYQQGDHDTASEAANAGTQLQNLVINLRSDLPAAANLHACVAGVAANGSNRDVVRASQAEAAATTASIDYFSNLDLQAMLYDGLHLNQEGKRIVGERFAVGFLDAGLAGVRRFYGNLACIGDSITQGGNGNHPSYRYRVFSHLAAKEVPISATSGYKFVGSVTGPYNGSALTTPDVNGQTFENVHDGHWGWRAFWENGRLALPASRRDRNRGEGTILNWTGQASPQEYDLNSLGNKVAYPDPAASGTGNTGTTYKPDTAVILIGINDLGDFPHDAVQASADISLMIDQLRAANPAVRIHLNLVLPTDRGLAWEVTKIDELNGYLLALADAKNAASPNSPVWIVDAASGFVPATMAYDKLHPNQLGEAHLGDHVAASLGLIATPVPVAVEPPHVESGSETLGYTFEGNEIYDGVSFINGWEEWDGADTTDRLNGSNLRHSHTNGDDSWLAGTHTGWAEILSGDWTWETRIKFHANPAGYFLWIGTGGNRIYIEIHGDRTQDYGNENFNVAHDNLDGGFHTYRVVHESKAGRYHVFRDGVRLTRLEGETYDSNAAESRFFMGDYTSGAFGDGYDVEIDYVRYGSGLFLPPGTDSDADGMSDAWEYAHFGDLVAAPAAGDDDGDQSSNLEEFVADTDPRDGSSVLKVESLVARPGSPIELQLPSSSQRQYTLLRSNDPGPDSAWTPVGGAVSGNGGWLILRDPSALADAPRRFYKVEAKVP